MGRRVILYQCEKIAEELLCALHDLGLFSAAGRLASV
jgi:hypothetical protein